MLSYVQFQYRMPGFLQFLLIKSEIMFIFSKQAHVQTVKLLLSFFLGSVGSHTDGHL